MTIGAFQETEKPRGQMTGKGTREYTRVGFVTCSEQEGAAAVKLAIPLGQVYAPVYDDPDVSAVLDRVTPFAFPGKKTRMRVELFYTTDPQNSSKDEDEENDPNPLAMPTKWSGEARGEQVDIELDKDGEPIVNTAGFPFTPKETDTIYHTVIRARKNRPTVDPFAIRETYLNKWNESAWTTNSFNIPEKRAKCVGHRFSEPKFKRIGQQTIKYVEETLEFEVYATVQEPRKRLSTGFHAFQAIGFDPGDIQTATPIVDSEGFTISEPAYLAEDGSPATRDTAAEVEISVNDTADFNQLGL